jgi:hypothetical protein
MNLRLVSLLALPWLVLMLAPVAGYIARRRRSPRQLVPGVLFISTLIPALALSGVSTSSQTLNLLLCLAAYAGYCILAAYSFAPARLALRIPLVVLAYLPIAAMTIFATIGILALAFLLAQTYPSARQQLRPGLVCETTQWGLPGGYELKLYRSLPAFPWVRRLVYDTSIDQTRPPAGPWPDCASAVQQYDHKP